MAAGRAPVGERVAHAVGSEWRPSGEDVSGTASREARVAAASTGLRQRKRMDEGTHTAEGGRRDLAAVTSDKSDRNRISETQSAVPNTLNALAMLGMIDAADYLLLC